ILICGREGCDGPIRLTRLIDNPSWRAGKRVTAEKQRDTEQTNNEGLGTFLAAEWKRSLSLNFLATGHELQSADQSTAKLWVKSPGGAMRRRERRGASPSPFVSGLVSAESTVETKLLREICRMANLMDTNRKFDESIPSKSERPDSRWS